MSLSVLMLLGVTVLSMVAALLSMALVHVKLGGRDRFAMILWLPQSSHQPVIPVVIVKVRTGQHMVQ